MSELIDALRTQVTERLSVIDAQLGPMIEEREQLTKVLAAFGTGTVPAPAPSTAPGPGRARRGRPPGSKNGAKAPSKSAAGKTTKAAKRTSPRGAAGSTTTPTVREQVEAVLPSIGAEETANEVAARLGLHAPTVATTMADLRREGKLPRRKGNTGGRRVTAAAPAPEPDGDPAVVAA